MAPITFVVMLAFMASLTQSEPVNKTLGEVAFDQWLRNMRAEPHAKWAHDLAWPKLSDLGRREWEAIAQAVAAVAVAKEREACAQVALDIFVGNTEIPTKDAAASKEWKACAETIYDEIAGRT